MPTSMVLGAKPANETKARNVSLIVNLVQWGVFFFFSFFGNDSAATVDVQMLTPIVIYIFIVCCFVYEYFVSTYLHIDANLQMLYQNYFLLPFRI